jgi:surface antigen
MFHARHHSATGTVLLMLLAAAALAGCADDHWKPAYWPQPGVLLDRPPPPVTVVRDGAAGVLIAGPAAPLFPDALADQAVAEALRPWLTEIERQRLAQASQRAADDFTLEPVAWEATDPTGAKTASGTAVAVDDVFRAVRGQLCRDLRQSIVKGDERHQEQVTLCRREISNDLFVWVIGNPNQ